MDTYLLFMAAVGVVVAGSVAGAVYRDATRRGLARRTTWALSTGGLSWIAVVATAEFAHPIWRALHTAIVGWEQPVTMRPFEVPLVGLLAGLVLVGLVVSTYRIGTSARIASPAK